MPFKTFHIVDQDKEKGDHLHSDWSICRGAHSPGNSCLQQGHPLEGALFHGIEESHFQLDFCTAQPSSVLETQCCGETKTRC